MKITPITNPRMPHPHAWYRRVRHPLAKLALAIPATLALTACQPKATSSTSISPAGTTALARATAHVQTAQEEVHAAKPHTNATGLTHLDIASRQQQYALDEQAQIAQSFQAVEQQFQSIQSAHAKLQDKYDALYRSWGATAERWIRRVFWIWLIGHVGLGIAALFIPGSAGAILAAIAAALNPAAWFQAIRDNAYFRFFASKTSASTAASSTTTTNS